MSTPPSYALPSSPTFTPGAGATGIMPTVASVATSQTKLDAAKAQLKAEQNKAKFFAMERAHLKRPSPNDKAATARYNAQVAKYNAQIKAANGTIASINKQLPGLQNQVYVDTGQYDKLLTGANRDAYLAVETLFNSYGLGTLAGKIYEYVKNGYSADTISILLQDTSEYKQRFAGNEARKAAGLPVLSAADYLATESSYQQIMQQAGLPSGFYDQPSDFSQWIGKNVSPSEIQGRVDLASQATTLANPEYRAALNQMGIDNSNLTAYFLDPTKALPYLQKAAATAQVGAEALRQNLTFDQSYAEQLATMGITADAARQGYQQIAGELDTLKAIAGSQGQSWDQSASEGATFGTSAEDVNRKGRLLSAERGAFSGNAGAASAGLSGTRSPSSG